MLVGPKTKLRPFYRGRGGVVVKTWRGQLVAARFPRKRGIRRRTLEEQDSIATFDAAVALYRWITAEERQAVTDACKGTQWLARDLHTVLMYGTFFMLTDTTGKRLYPMAYGDKVSEALDSLGYEVGSIMVRTDDGWRYLPPGNPGQVLTSNGPGVPPSWETP